MKPHRTKSKLRKAPGHNPVPLAKNGVPVNVHDWTDQDWADLHHATQTAVKKIAARHAK